MENSIYNTNFTLCSHNTDFEPRHRDEIINYIIERFGRDYVVNIGTFGIARTKVAIQDVGRVFCIPAQETLAVTKAIGDEVDEDAPFQDVVDSCTELKMYLEKWKKVGEDEEKKPINERVEWRIQLKNLQYFIEGVKGNARNISQHACGVLISSDKLVENVALGRSRGRLVSGWQEGSDFHELSDLGYYKFDILGLNNLQVVNDTVALVKKRHNVEIDWQKIDLNEKEVYETVVKNQDHMGVFQFESNLAHKIMKDIVPSNFDELSAISSLLRPGPLKMGMPDQFANRKWGRPDETGHVWTEDEIPACIKDILAPTKGIIVYQEQFMLIAMKIGGQTNKEVNAFRKALVKYGKGAEAEAKRYAQVESYHQTFVKNAKLPENLGDEKKAEDLWNLIAAFAKYGFNKTLSFDETVEEKTRGKLTLEQVRNLLKLSEKLQVKSSNGEKDIWVDVVTVHDHGVQDLVEVELEDGKKIKCTIDHKFRTTTGEMLPLYEILEEDLEIEIDDMHI